jgi:hypothetical protein
MNSTRTRTLAVHAIASAVVMLAVLSCSESTKVSHGAPASLVAISPLESFGPIKTAVAPLTVKVTDKDTVAIQGATIAWTLSGPGSLSATATPSDRNGEAKTTFTFGDSAGTSSVSATVNGLTTVITFDATASAPGVRDDWVTYNHDGNRSGASQASVKGPITKLWSYTPAAPSGTRPFQYVLDALPTADAIFLQWSAQTVLGPGYIGATEVDRVTTAGQRAWTHDGGYDANIGHWGSVFGSLFVFQDDGIGYLDVNTGHQTFFSGVDRWGETLANGAVLYVDHNWHVDGPGLFVARLNSAGTKVWTALSYGKKRGDGYDDIAGIALNGSTLFVAGDYWADTSIVNPPKPGVYALQGATGTQLAFAATKPTSKISADGANVYLIENSNTLVARAQSDLHVVWHVAVTSPGGQAPVIANRAVIISTSAGVESHVAATGTLKWRKSISGVMSYINGLPGPSTTLAAALGSGTLVATSSTDGIHILKLTDGTELSHLALAYPNTIWDPVIVNDPAKGTLIYGVTYSQLVAFSSP